MDYKGTLYGKIGGVYFPLAPTSDDYDNLKQENESLKEGVKSKRTELISFLRKQSKLHYITIYENDFDFADKIIELLTK